MNQWVFVLQLVAILCNKVICVYINVHQILLCNKLTFCTRDICICKLWTKTNARLYLYNTIIYNLKISTPLKCWQNTRDTRGLMSLRTAGKWCHIRSFSSHFWHKSGRHPMCSECAWDETRKEGKNETISHVACST